MTDKPDRGNAVVSLPELRRGNIGLVVATQIARFVVPGNNLPGWHSPAQAWAQTQGQLAWYKEMEAAGEMVQIASLAALENHVEQWLVEGNNEDKPIGYILSLEGADSIVTIGYLEKGLSKRVTGRWPGTLWTRALCAGHRCQWVDGRSWS
jgi:membrane dipeptidase